MRSITKKEFKEIVSKIEPSTKKQLEEANGVIISQDGTIQDSTSCIPSDDSLDRIYTIGYDYLEKNRKKDVDVEKIRGTFEGRNLGQSYLRADADILKAEKYRQEIEQLHAQFQDYLKKSLEIAIRIGELLHQQKLLMVHGTFTHWAERHLPFTLRTAQNYMRLYAYREALSQKNITTINEAYAAISGEPAPDEVIFVDNDTKTKDFMVSLGTIDLEGIDVPKKILKGYETKMTVNKSVIDEMKKDNGDYARYKGRITKMLIRMPYNIDQPLLFGEFLQAAVSLMRAGGKIIFYKE